MFSSAERRSERRHTSPTRLRAAWGACVALALAFGGPLDAQVVGSGSPTPAETRIPNRAAVEYTAAAGATIVLASGDVEVVVGQVAGVDLEPNRSIDVTAGDTAVFAHTLTNLGNGRDSFPLTADTPGGWTAPAFYHDVDGDGLLSAADTLLTAPVALDAGAQFPLLVVQSVPGSDALGAASLTVSATSAFDSSRRDSVVDTLTVSAAAAGARLDLGKSVDRPIVLPGEIATWTLRATVADGPAGRLLLADTLPERVTYVPGSILLDGAPLTDEADGDAARYVDEARAILVELDDAAGDTVVLTFSTRLDDDATEGLSVRNDASASLTLSDGATGGAAASADFEVGAAPAVGELELAKRLLTQVDSLFEGDTIRWEIEVTNPSTVDVVDAVLTDVVPAGVSALDATPMWDEASSAGDTLVWRLGTLTPDARRVITLHALAGEVEAVVPVVNRARVAAPGVEADSAEAAPATLYPRPDEPDPTLPASLGLTLQAEQLEVEAGDRLRLFTTVRNDGPVRLHDLQVDLGIPAGTRLVDEAVLADLLSPEQASALSQGAALTLSTAEAAAVGLTLDANSGPIEPDSLRITPDRLTVWLPTTLAPGAVLELRYRVRILTGIEGRILARTRVTGRPTGPGADVDSDAVVTDEASVEALVRRVRGLETRMIVGRVFVDLDGNGRQDAGEPGVPGAEIWTEDGDVVRVDAFGKFSLVNVRPGRHALRLDPTTLPAGLAFADGGQAGGTVWVESTAWLTPRADFALRPTAEWGAEDRPADAMAGPTADVVRVGAVRSDSARAAAGADHFVRGPGVMFFTPEDGLVSASNKVYLGVRGEAGRPVQLLRGDSVLAEATLRPDGVHDFVGVELVPGPQLFVARMQNSWGQTRLDSLRVHHSGAPASVEGPTRLEVAAGARTSATVGLRLLDRWGVPVTGRPMATVEVSGILLSGTDDDPASVGHQARADEAGWLEIEVSGSDDTGRGELEVVSGSAEYRVDVDVVADVRSLFVNGAGQIGIGLAGESFGALTARGALDERTSLTVSYDSRTLDQDQDAFGRPIDPLAEDRYPKVGDASEQRAVSASRYAFYAKVERDLDWLVVGDIREGWFDGGLGLADYRRAVPGAAARVTTGDVVWNAFGATTTQALVQEQFRGDGTAGPFQLGGTILRGTDRVAIEVRARENASRIVARDELDRFVEYEIDYANGLILLKRPIPATDPSGNPLFLVVSFERDGGGERSLLLGLRGATDLAPVLGLEGSETSLRMPISASVVRDDAPGVEYTLGAASAGIESAGGARLAGEVAWASAVDSTGVAARVEGELPLFDDRLRLSGLWGRIGEEFTNPSNVGVQAGVEEARVGARLVTDALDLGLDWDRQAFGSADRDRSRLAATARRDIAERVDAELRLSSDRLGQDGGTSRATGVEAELGWNATDRLRFTAEAREELERTGSVPSLGSFAGLGATFRLLERVSLEARHRLVSPGGLGEDYSLSSIGVTSNPGDATRAWGSYQLAGSSSGYLGASVVGLNHQFTISDAWRVQTLVERRDGVGAAAVGDPVLASPFEQEEQDYLALALGVEYLPEAAPYRVSARAETKDATGSRTNLLRLAGDVALSDDFGVLTRQEFAERDRALGTGVRYSRDRASLWGVAWRPAASNTFSVLGRFEWRDAVNPLGRTLLQGEGEERRVLGAVEAMWLPTAGLELSGRVAARDAQVTEFSEAGPIDRSSDVRFVGGRARLDLDPRLAIGVTARGLLSDAEGVWDVFPALIVRPASGLELETGYHFGDLQDPDFAVRGGEGWYASIGFRFTERLTDSVVDFWRERF